MIQQNIHFPPNVLKYYLKRLGWYEKGNYQDIGTIWKHEYSKQSLLLPNNQYFEDYLERQNLILHTLSKQQEIDINHLESKLFTLNTDNLKVRIADKYLTNGLISLKDGEDLFGGIYDLIVSSAHSTEHPKLSFYGKKTKQVSKILNDIKLGHTETGSFIVNIVSEFASSIPLANSLFEDVHSFNTESFERRTFITLFNSLKFLKDNIQNAIQTNSIDYQALENGIDLGFSTNLCDALLKLSGTECKRNIDLSMAWSPIHQIPALTPSQIIIETIDIDIVSDIQKYYKNRIERDQSIVKGFVTGLHRKPNDQVGRIELLTQDDKYDIFLDSEMYDIALHAHDQKQIIECTGQIIRKNNKRPYMEHSIVTVLV